MPACVMDNVPFSEMRGTNLHQGPRTAGNKSMLAYRSDIGIPGYTGYCPGWSTVPVPVGGANKHTGRLPAGTELPAEALKQTDQQQTVSEYHSSFKAEPSAYHPPAKTGGGYLFAQRQRQATSSNAAFSGATTYGAELLKGPDTEQQQKQQLEGVPRTLVNYQVARSHRSQSADGAVARSGAISLSSTTASTAVGLVGYRTTYGSTNRALEEKQHTAAADAAATAAARASDSRPHSCPEGSTEELRMAVMPSVAKRFEGSSTYERDFGPLGCDPMQLATSNPSMQTLLASTRELNEGTTRGCKQPAGYGGFMPAAATNPVALQQAAGLTSRPDAKAAMLPSALDQYSRSLMKGYTGYKPQGGAAATAVLPAKGPTAETTQGFVNLQVRKNGPQRVDHTYCINSRTGLMSFFTGGGESVSDNGLADAQTFFVGRRPLGGRMKH